MYITWVTSGSSSLSTARVRISRLFGSHLKLMLAVLMVVMFSQTLFAKKQETREVEKGETDSSLQVKTDFQIQWAQIGLHQTQIYYNL